MSHSTYYLAKQKKSIGITKRYQILSPIFFYESLRKGLWGKKKTYNPKIWKRKLEKPRNRFVIQNEKRWLILTKLRINFKEKRIQIYGKYKLENFHQQIIKCKIRQKCLEWKNKVFARYVFFKVNKFFCMFIRDEDFIRILYSKEQNWCTNLNRFWFSNEQSNWIQYFHVEVANIQNLLSNNLRILSLEILMVLN